MQLVFGSHEGAKPRRGEKARFRFQIRESILYSGLMKFRPFLTLLFVGLLAIAMGGVSGCAAFKKKPKIAKPPEPTMADQSSDASFQAFRNRLQKAVAKRDLATLAPMMSGDFHYGWDADATGAGVFDYWNRNNLWPELELVLREKFVPYGDFMVAPREFTFDSGYKGYRAGLQLVNGAWRFAYFVPAPPASEIPAQ